ncbi:MAG: T9SS type A sorting domain-containing protein [Calditrichaeota bacterium]|nr:T9SS type A sorting domain-containing protein [Calditrichota bacterium]
MLQRKLFMQLLVAAIILLTGNVLAQLPVSNWTTKNGGLTFTTKNANQNIQRSPQKASKKDKKWIRKSLQYWKNNYNVITGGPFSSMNVELLAKGQPDECFLGVGDPGNLYNPQWDNQPIVCTSGVPKVNQAYIWGLAKNGDNLWFGTIANTHILVLGGMLSMIGSSLDPIETDSWVGEYNQGHFSPLLPDAIKDWRPPRIFVYNTQTNTLSEKTPIADPLLQTTLGIRGVGTLGDIVLMGGPALSGAMPGTGAGINLFAFNAQTGAYLGSTSLLQYGDIRSFLVVYDELYFGVGTATGGKVLRWTGDTSNPFQFEEVGAIDGDASNLAFFEDRIFVSTWGLNLFGNGGLSGLWMSPEIPLNGKLDSGDQGDWSKAWEVTEYEPDIVTAQTTFGGALAAYNGYLYWGTMHVPLLSLIAHIKVYGAPQDTLGFMTDLLATHRPISLFRGRNFGTNPEIDLLYGMPALPEYTPDDPLNPTSGGNWDIVPNNMGSLPLYGPSGFGNFFNTYTWSMAVHKNQLFVGTFDWSYLLMDLLAPLTHRLSLSLPDTTIIERILGPLQYFYGADLFRFTSTDLPAIPESISGVGNYTNYGIRNMVSDGDSLYLGMANPMNLLTDLTDDKPEGGWELLKLSGEPSNPNQILAMLKLFWQNIYVNLLACIDPSPTLGNWLLAKAAPDECFFGIGNPSNNYNPQLNNLPIDCSGGGKPKVNQAYIWGLTSAGDSLWFGTWANGLQQVLGSISLALGVDFPPIQTNSWVAEFGASPLSPPLPSGFGDWRPPRIFVYNPSRATLTEKIPTNPALLSTTAGIRSAGAVGDVVIFGGPTSVLGGTGINLFAFNAQTGAPIGSTNLPQYNDIRQWLVVNGILYAGVGTPTGGKVLKWVGDVSNPFLFEEVGNLGENAAYLAFHENRIFVSTWGGQIFGLTGVSGIWMSPEIPLGGNLSAADAGNWSKVWEITDYEPDTVTAHTTLGGALASFDGYLYWGTMHVPATAAIGHFITYGLPASLIETVIPIVGTFRSTSLFRGQNFGTPGETKEVLYGMPVLPAYDPVNGWQIVPNKMGDPLYGMSGFGNIFNNYTWSMAVYENQLFVGTMDWSYLGSDLIHSFVQAVMDSLQLHPVDPALLQQIRYFFHNRNCFHGADLWRFPSSVSPAIPENISGVGNSTNYGIRNMVVNGGLFLGTANPMNLLTDQTDELPEGGWELIELARDTDHDRIPDHTEKGGDRDGDSVVDSLDYDPTGYIYDEDTGKILSGGKVSVTGPGPVTIVEDGSNGYFQFYITAPGIYTINLTLPPHYAWSQTCLAKTGPFDPTGKPNPVVLGNGEDGNTGYLTSNECTDFYFEFDLVVTDPVIINNNFPLRYTEPTGITLSSFTAEIVQAGILINWTTETEPNNAGFNIFRSQNENGEYVKINESMIPAQGNATSGVSYSYTDSPENTGTYYYKLQAISLTGDSSFHGPVSVTVTSIDIKKYAVPENYSLSQNYPNPFNPETTIEFGLPAPGFVELSIYDINGKLVQTLISEEKRAGNYQVKWDARGENGVRVSSGIYFYIMKISDSAKGGTGFSQTNKMILMK